MDWSKANEVLAAAVRDKVFPGCQLLVARSGEVLFYTGCGTLSDEDTTKVDRNTVYDVASLTKVLVTTNLALFAIEKELFTLNDDPLIFLGLKSRGVLTIRHLLTHVTGYIPTYPFYKELEAKKLLFSEAARSVVLEYAEEHQPLAPPAEAIYSDINFLLLGFIIEKVFESSLSDCTEQMVVRPLSLSSTFFTPLPQRERASRQIAPTRNEEWRKRVLIGEVHDENAAALGGIAGHAGLFSTAHETFVIARSLLDSYHGKSKFFPQRLLKEFWTRDSSTPHTSRALGWDTPSQGSTSGNKFSSHSVGHTGFTGCSLWIDIPREVIIVHLSNRVYSLRDNIRIKAFRPAIHNLVMSVLGY